MGRLSPRETFLLFAAMMAFSLLMFAGGIYVGMHYYVAADPVTAEGVDSSPAEDVKAQLDFYDELMDDSTGKAQPAHTATEAARPPDSGRQNAPPSPPPNPPQPASSTLPKIEVGYTVQVGAVNNRQDADQLIQRLQQRGYTGMVVDPEKGGDRYFRVWVGQFETRPEAEKLDERLKADQFKTYVKKVRFP